MGPEKYKGLWTGQTDWNGPEVKQALETMAKMLEYVNPDHSALSWDQANDLVIQGKAGMTIMGYRARIRNHGHSCFLCEIVIRSQFHTTYEPEA
jgi:carbohydrate ABC transporter substrate-binding protein, CUT1 family (TC 3.A.1.1.-)